MRRPTPSRPSGSSDDLAKLYASQSQHVRREVHRREVESIGRAARTRDNHIDCVLHGAVLFVVVHTLICGFYSTLTVFAVGALVGEIWHRTRADRSVAATIGGLAYAAVLFKVAGFSYMLVFGAAVVGAFSGLMARQRMAAAFGA